MRLIVAICCIVLLGGCSASHRFCEGNGYIEDSPAYNQCRARYDLDETFYDYCEEREGLTVEGPELNDCLVRGKRLKAAYEKEAAFCLREANDLYADVISGPRITQVATLLPSGQLLLENMSENISYSQAEKGYITAPYRELCLHHHGWNVWNDWGRGKRAVSFADTAKELTAMNQARRPPELPKNEAARLFTEIVQNRGGVPVSLDYGNAQIRNHQGYTPLHIAAESGNLPTVKALLSQYSVDLDALSHAGESAYTLAYRARQNHVMNYMEEYLREQVGDKDLPTRDAAEKNPEIWEKLRQEKLKKITK